VTLISVLKGIAYGWSQDQLAENAERIRCVASEFYDRMQVFYDFYADTGRQLEKAVEVYNKSARSWESRLTPSLRKMRELGVGSGDDPVAPELIDLVSARPKAVGQ
jgi:DNA recombination protein RmuC